MAHTVDVDAMLDSMPEGLFAEWCEFDGLEPVGNQPICMTITNLALAICNYLGMKLDGQNLGPQNFMWWWRKVKAQPKYASPKEAARQWRMTHEHR